MCCETYYRCRENGSEYIVDHFVDVNEIVFIYLILFYEKAFMRNLLILFLFLSSCLFSVEKYTLCVCAIFQNEAPYLKEWIDYHESKGVEHFFLYNNDSTDEYLAVLSPYFERGCITLIDWSSKHGSDGYKFAFKVQIGAYNDAISKCRHVSKWLALIDIDEFIVPVAYGNLVQLLEKDYEYCSGLCVNWQCYGTSNVTRCNSVKDELLWKMRWDHDWNKQSM